MPSCKSARVTIMLLGHWLEMRSIGQASGALRALAKLLPSTATRVVESGGSERLRQRLHHLRPCVAFISVRSS